jgi:hypothetical protein
MRLTRYAPARMLCTCAADMAVRLLRMLPASLAPDTWLTRGNAAKSRAVKVPDFLSACLGSTSISHCQERWNGSTYGLGMGASSSNDDTKGIWAGTAGE